MPTTYECDSCGWKRSVGNYHGWPGEWYFDLYCRSCGAPHTLKQHVSDASGKISTHLDGVELHHADRGIKLIVECGGCGAKGPYGTEGPITDSTPKICPKCGSDRIKNTSEWIT